MTYMFLVRQKWRKPAQEHEKVKQDQQNDSMDIRLKNMKKKTQRTQERAIQQEDNPTQAYEKISNHLCSNYLCQGKTS